MQGETAAIYCRLSVEDREKGMAESESIQNQKSLLWEYAEKQGWKVYGVYADEDYSGLREDRPAFQQMLEAAKEGRFSIILCKTQSRFTRNAATAERYFHQLFPLWGIRFVTVVDHVDTALRANKKARQINSLVNEWYSEELSENIRAVFRRKMEEGQFLGNYAPYGYLKDPARRHHLIPDGETAPVVEKIYDLYLSGLSCKMIAERLTAEGVLTPTQIKKQRGQDLGRKDWGKWSAGTVRKILQNPVYLGHMAQGKEEKISFKEKKTRELPKDQWIVVENTHEAVIKKEIFAEVGRRMARQRKVRPLEKNSRSSKCKSDL
ncbi:recombinase family protein [Anaerotignum sp.]